MATSREMTEGRALPLIFNFTLPLLLGNLLQQTLFIGGCSHRGALSGYQRLGFSRGKHFGRFSYSGILQWLLRRFRHSRGAKVRCAGLCHDAPLCGCQPAAGCGDVCCHCRGFQHLLCRYSAHDEYAGEHIHGSLLFTCLSRLSGFPLLSSIICCPVLSVHWVTARRRFAQFLLLSTVLNILLDLYWVGEWQELPSLPYFHKASRPYCATSI